MTFEAACKMSDIYGGNESASILIVDNDPDTLSELSEYLSSNGFSVLEAESNHSALQQINSEKIDLVIFDLWIGKDNGFDLLRDIRQRYSTPCIIAAANDEATDKIVGLELGADDYVVKPVNLRELLARIRALLRRSRSRREDHLSISEQQEATPSISDVNGWHFDPIRRNLLSPNGDHVLLTTAECDLLIELVAHEGRAQTREDLCMRVFSRDWQPYDRSLDSIVVKLRRKLEPNPNQPMVIKTIRGKGYLFTGFPEDAR